MRHRRSRPAGHARGGGACRNRSDPYACNEDLKRLIGHNALGSDGKTLGRVSDVVATLGDGTLVAIVIDQRSTLTPKEPHAIVWHAFQGLTERGEVRVVLGAAEFAKTPFMTTMAPRWAEHDPSAAPANRDAGFGSSRLPAYNETVTPPPPR